MCWLYVPPMYLDWLGWARPAARSWELRPGRPLAPSSEGLHWWAAGVGGQVSNQYGGGHLDH